MATEVELRRSVIVQTERPQRQVDAGRLLLVGGMVVLLTTAINLLIASGLRAWLQIPAAFTPLGAPAVATVSVAGMAGSVIVFAWLARTRPRPERTFVSVAAVALVLSWLPDIAIWVTSVFAGTTTAGILSLMSLHVVAAVIAVGLLAGFGLRQK